mgnify:CR=1 FL=1
MSAIDKVRALIAKNPQHAVTAAREFEALYKAHPDHSGYRRVYFELQQQINSQYPITRPAIVEPPAEAWDDESHAYWTTDPETRWSAAYARMGDKLGWVNARMIVSELQRKGQDII